jgi:hypothetical protein
MDHVTLNFNNNVFTAAVFWDIEKVFDTAWHLGLLYELSELKFSISLIKLISSFLPQRKLGVSVESEMSTLKDIQAGMAQGSILFPTLYNICINDTPQTSDVYLSLFAKDACMNATDRKRLMFSESCSEVSVLLRRCVSAGT